MVRVVHVHAGRRLFSDDFVDQDSIVAVLGQQSLQLPQYAIYCNNQLDSPNIEYSPMFYFLKFASYIYIYIYTRYTLIIKLKKSIN